VGACAGDSDCMCILDEGRGVMISKSLNTQLATLEKK